MNKKHFGLIYIKKTTKEEVFFYWNELLVRKKELEGQKKYIIEEGKLVELGYHQIM